MSRYFSSGLVRNVMLSSIAIRFQRFPYLVIGWVLLAAVSLVAPDRLFLTPRQGILCALGFLGVALVRGSRQIGHRLPLDIGALTLARLPRQTDMQYIGHGFAWTAEI